MLTDRVDKVLYESACEEFESFLNLFHIFFMQCVVFC